MRRARGIERRGGMPLKGDNLHPSGSVVDEDRRTTPSGKGEGAAPSTSAGLHRRRRTDIGPAGAVTGATFGARPLVGRR
ncbi:hypothetical protein XA68_11157 [Ophiocordyceps unilateralis]|uniref:Uncharacterized protein n=1 Tax=Ophiocordyceps unilateralis TaxID=268505 RepID=A0A2A9PH14_OPHUN|nr:hypothetical protein XA68_11157 [Ophiocordyceps unilateralis]